ncbi:hypothetical protein OG453_00770 [Streptomyces sp. NBC_01381]|uniref:DUF6571 family protein n=1 Tax=Streptomyces sp. NBC_01381 TaxID=2903845 RepID=UPI00225863A5|nr:DUF6571 family protein [Streptomyces sp. NBC_01381]MCX4665218.1 hypothetical protein [Streptomyces sp. NBC_01381]
MVSADNPGPSGVFSGIDPDALKGTIESIRRDHEKLSDRAGYYKLQLAYYGVGADELADVLRVANWASDELPLLKRRYHLSMKMDSVPYPGGKGMVQINEASVTRAANAAAAKDAKRAAKLAKKDPEDLTPKEFDELNRLFATNHDEYPFAEKFAAALGPKKTLQFWEQASRLGDDPGYGRNSDFERESDLDDLQRNLSFTIAQATNSGTPAMNRWKKEMIELGSEPVRESGPPPHGDSGGPKGFVVMSNLMRFGDYDDKFLYSYGKALVKEDKSVMEGPGSGWTGWNADDGTLNHIGNDMGADPMTGFMKALSNSPDASTEFFTDKQKGADGKPESNFKYLFEEREWQDDSMEGKESVTGRNSMAWALEAATTGHRPGEPATADDLKHSKEQAALFSDVVKSVSEDQDRLRDHAYMSDSFANAAAEYMPDLHRGMTPDKSLGSQLFPTLGAVAKIDNYDAARFLHTVARNEEGYDTLNISQHVYAASLMEQQAKHPDTYPLNTDETISQISYDTGLFQGVIGKARHFQADESDADAAARDDAWKGHVSTWGGSVVGSAAGVATAPFSGPGGVVVGGLAGTASTKIFDGIINGFGDDGGKEAKEQVYQNVKEMDKVEYSVILTSQHAVKEATGSEAAESRAGGDTSKGFRDAGDLIRDSNATVSVI